ncbi:tRNA (guanine(10)-N(2))-dimethyltransferase [Candidatus Woesearchaeota archaeon]|nr:tRNA (guanine(10)-N(2))-dimethyltransferase [Candidatus Woesearchaeota archaeon]
MRITEGSVTIDVSLQKAPSKTAPVFFNPVMKLNRDISVLFLNALNRKLSCADILAGSGIRALRLMKECNVDVIANDVNPLAVKSMKKNAKLNGLKLNISDKEANKFLLDSEGFDYIDIDPFGSPNPFLDIAVKRVSRKGYLGVTATDTSALSGSHIKAGLRKYWGHPVKNECMHETGIRLLIRKVQLIGAQYAKALVPVFCHASQHYYRVYFECSKGKEKVDNIMKQHKYVDFNKDFSITTSYENQRASAGPVWTGKLWNRPLVNKMLKNAEGEAKDLLGVIKKEAAIPTVGFYDYYAMCSKLGKNVPDRISLFSKLKKKGKLASETHFSYKGVRTNATVQQLLSSL